MEHTARRSLCALFLLLILTPSLVLAQHTVDVSGTVRDEMGKPVSNAHLSALRSESNQGSKAVSGADGVYLLRDLAIGSYTVTIQASGFAARRIEFTLTGSADKATLDVTLAHSTTDQESHEAAPAGQIPLMNRAQAIVISTEPEPREECRASTCTLPILPGSERT